MSPRPPDYDDDRAPMKVTKDSKLTTNIGVILALLVAAWAASSQWNSTKRDGEELASKVISNTGNLNRLTESQKELQITVLDLNGQIKEIRARQESQLIILRYLATGRIGPIPEAAK